MLNVQHITKILSDKSLFEDISFKISDNQKVGLVGPNGAGKTTLLNIIAGKDDADSGQVLLSNEVVGYLPQKLITSANEEIGRYLTTFLKEEWEDYRIDEVLAQVGLKNIPKRTLISKLSGGQKMKVGLAGLLLTDPTLLLLDEPTNNLDMPSITWLERFVQHFPGKVIVISHDRFFLDACVTKILELNPYTHKITEYGGNYTEYKALKQAHHEHQESEYRLQQLKEKHMLEWIAEKRQQLQYHPSNKVARQLKAMKTRYEREIVQQKIDKPKVYQSFKAESLGQQLAKQKGVISLYDFSVFDLLNVNELHIFGQDRIHLQGPNGTGKTTLLKSILGLLNFYSGEIEIGPNLRMGYFSQEHELLSLDTPLIEVFMQQTDTFDEAKARSVLGAFMFSKQKVFSNTKYLSEGEKARLLIAILICQNNDFLILDEPTNHLDLESREVLADALKDYPGGFIVVSHDRYFLQQIGINRVLTIAGKHIH